MKPLWKIRSRNFARRPSDELPFDAEGGNVGYFDGNEAFSPESDFFGEIFE